MTTNLQWVPITGGKHKGKRLRFVKLTEQKVCVERELDGKKIYLNPEHVNLNGVTASTSTASSRGNAQNGPSVTSTPNPPRPVSPADIAPNTWVRIIDGKHKGKTVRYLKHTAERIAVQLEQGKLIYLIPDHVDMNGVRPYSQPRPASRQGVANTLVVSPLQPVTPDAEVSVNRAFDTIEFAAEQDFATTMDEESYDFVSAAEDLTYNGYDGTAASLGDCSHIPTPNTLSSGDRFRIHSGIHSGKMAIFVKNTAERVAIKLEGETKIRYLSPNCLVAGSAAQTSCPPQEEDDPMVRAIRHHLPHVVRVQNVTASKVHQTLFGVKFGHDAVFFDIDTASLTKLPEKFIYPLRDCQTYVLAAVKLHDKAKSLTCAYLCASSNEQVASRLLSIGAFNKLIARKTAARLELLLSTSAQADHIHLLNPSNFTFISEQGNVGCGFIPRSMIDLLLGRHAPKVCALQVRILIPSMGIFKGMLMEKPGISQIELPPSMKKVDAAVSPNTSVAWIMLNQTGIYPYEARIKQHANSFQEVREIPKMAQHEYYVGMLPQKWLVNT